MFKDREKLYQVYHTVLTIALTLAIVLVINTYSALNVSVAVTAFYCLVPSLLIYLVDTNKKNMITYLLIVSIVPIIGLIFWINKTNPISWAENFINWIAAYNGSEELYMAGYAHFAVFGIALTASIIFYLLTSRQITKIILAIILLATLIIMSISNVEINKVVVGIGIFYFMTIVVELYGIIYNRKDRKQEKREGILYLAPICLLLAILAIILPSKPEPLQWKAVKYVYNNVKEQIEVWRTDINYYLGNTGSEFAVSLTGYSEDNADLESKGNLVKDNKVAMKISGLDKGKTAYLIGSISDIYTGTSWEKSRADFLPDQHDYLLDYIEMFYALSRQDIEVLENNRFLERKSIKIEYSNIKTKSFFYPIKMCSFDMFTKYKKLSTKTAQINFLKARGKGTSYQTVFFEMNLQGDAFMQMLRDADNFSYNDFNIVNMQTARYVQEKVLSQDEIQDLLQSDYYGILKDRAELIETEYTVLPETLPDRVYELAQEITADYDNKFDKMKAIETYLLSTYTYSMEAQKIPEGADFIDNFLFESKEGYCTSFASALAVMGRCVGIPTRYVEGFLGNFTFRDKKDQFSYIVTNSQAHAWTEAYIEGIGWIPYEATAPFYTNRYTKWIEFPKSSKENSPLSGYAPQVTDEHSQPFQPVGEVVTVEEDNTAEIISGIITLIATMIILLLVFIIYYYVMKYRYKKSYEHADHNAKMYMLFLRILRLLRREGFILDQQETILMLSDRVKDKFQFGRIIFPEVALIFMRYRYAEENVTEEDLGKMAIYHQGLKNKQKEEVSRLKAWLEEFMFLARKGTY